LVSWGQLLPLKHSLIIHWNAVIFVKRSLDLPTGEICSFWTTKWQYLDISLLNLFCQFHLFTSCSFFEIVSRFSYIFFFSWCKCVWFKGVYLSIAKRKWGINLFLAKIKVMYICLVLKLIAQFPLSKIQVKFSNRIFKKQEF